MSNSEAEQINNIYAHDIKQNVVYVEDVERGKKGYYCMGCNREMQAVKQKSDTRRSFFRHHAEPGVKYKKCTYSDETYRHKIAKEILQRTKTIKVPQLLKYPPKGQEGNPILISPAREITGHTAKNERYFYETDDGEIKWCKKGELKDKSYLIRADVAFFDKKDEPILLIEIVATHKVTDEKRIKLKRLGIDTVSVTIPKDSKEAIEATFSRTSRTKWEYSYEQERFEYLPTSDTGTTKILPTDEEQRKLLEESYNCRASEIRFIIRTIERCLESEPYRISEQALRSELSRVERNTTENQEQWAGIQEGIRTDVEKQYGDRREKLENEEREFQRYAQDLERRYKRKRGLLERQIEEKFGGNSFDERRTAIERKRGNIEYRIDEERREIDRIIREAGELPDKFEQLERQEEELFEHFKRVEETEIRRIEQEGEGLPDKYKRIEGGIREQYQATERGEKREIKAVEQETDRLPEEFRKDEDKLRREFKERTDQDAVRVKERSGGGDGEFSRRLKKLIEDGSELKHYKEAYELYHRNRSAWNAITTGAYKNWEN